MPMIPDLAPYPTHHRYDQNYSSSRNASAHHVPNHRPLSHQQQLNQWTQPIMAPEHMDPYVRDHSLVF